MRMHIELDDELVARIDAATDARGRTSFIRNAIEKELDQRRRWELIQAARGTISSGGHDWDSGSRAWVAGQRRADKRRLG